MSKGVLTWVRSVSTLLLVVTLGASSPAEANSAGISTFSFDFNGCNQCHSGGVTPTVTLSGPDKVLPSSTNEYTLKIIGSDSQNRGGLNVSTSDGVLSLGGSNSANTRTISGPNGDEITHSSPKTAAGGGVTFSFLFTAPSSFETVSLEAWGNSVNGDATSAGDRAAFATLDISPGEPSLCAATPATGCRQPTVAGAASFQLKDNSNDAKDALTWKWNKGAATATADFGDPVNGSTNYVLCVYDGTNSLVMSASAPAGGTCGTKPCWKALKKGFKYVNKALTPDGLSQVQLTTGAEGKAKITVTGKGTNLAMPVLPLTQSPSVVVQLVNSNGVCWDATYSSPAKKNDSSQFNDKSD